MRRFIILAAMLALAALPCAWDSDPRQPSPLAAIMAEHMR